MKLQQRLIVALFALVMLCIPLATFADPPGHSRQHQKHYKHQRPHKKVKPHKYHEYAPHHRHHKYTKHRRHDAKHYRHHRYAKHHSHHRHHDHVVIVEPHAVPQPRPGVGVEIETGGVTIEGEVLF